MLTHDDIAGALKEVRRRFADPAVRAALPLGLGGRLTRLAAAHPTTEALVCGADRRTFADANADANRLARAMAARGVGGGDLVAIVLPNGVAFIEIALAAWKLGAVAFPLSHRYPDRERDEILELAQPRLVVGTDDGQAAEDVGAGMLFEDARELAGTDLPDVATTPWKAVPSGGSTGRPKLIVAHGDNGPVTELTGAVFGAKPGGRVLIPAPMYHNGPFAWGVLGLMAGATLVVLEHFDAENFLHTIEQEAITWVYTVPTMLKRVMDLDEKTRRAFDLSSLEVLLHTSAPCPAWLKRQTIEGFGAEVVWEFYGATEVGGTMIRGDEWLERPGSVGRPFPGVEAAVRDPDTGADLETGEIGELFLRPPAGPRFRYRGADERIVDGFVSVGDLGSVDADGYLYLSDRRKDLIITGGVNVYPAEVEAALLEHPCVADVGVIGLADPEWGQIVHAVVQPAPSSHPTEEDLKAFCRERLAPHKVPRSFELVDDLGRDPSGKLRRSALKAGGA